MGNKIASAAKTVGKTVGGAAETVGKTIGHGAVIVGKGVAAEATRTVERAKQAGKALGVGLGALGHLVQRGVGLVRRVLTVAEHQAMGLAERIPVVGPHLRKAVEWLAEFDVPIINMSVKDALQLGLDKLEGIENVANMIAEVGDQISGKRKLNIMKLAEVAGGFKAVLKTTGLVPPGVASRIDALTKKTQGQIISTIQEKAKSLRISQVLKHPLVSPFVSAAASRIGGHVKALGVPDHLLASAKSYLM